MPELHALSAEELVAFKQFELAREQVARREIARLGASARLRVAQSIAAGLDPTRRPQLRLLSALASRTATAYARLEHIDGAIRFARRMLRKAARRAGLPTATPGQR